MNARITQYTISPDEIFSERTVTVSIDNDGGGEYIMLRSMADDGGEVCIEPDNWEHIKTCVETLISSLRKGE